MKRIVETEEETRRAVAEFRHRITDLGGSPEVLDWEFPDGEKVNCPTYTLNSTHGDIQIGVPTSWSNRIPHLLSFMKERGPTSPDVEINIPNTLNRRVSGAYVATDASIWLCTRGDFTAFRGKIPRAATLSHFQKWLIEAKDGDRKTQVIPVAALDSASLSDDLAEFIQSVLDLKKTYKSGLESTHTAPSVWRTGKEFEGLKKPSRNRAPEEYEYTHGPLCNGLLRCLTTALANRPDLVVRSNANVDAAVVAEKNQRANVMFEVKTSADLGSQIYSAIGQLLVYKRLYGSEDCAMVLVLPSQFEDEARRLSALLEPLAIQLLVGNGTTFRTLVGLPLNEFLHERLRALQA